VRVQIDSDKCQGHGRCYDLAPDVFTDDEEGNGQVIGDGTITPGNEESARLAVANCPESAISLIEED
jgi:ferredoxin